MTLIFDNNRLPSGHVKYADYIYNPLNEIQ